MFARKTGLGSGPRRLRVLLVSPYYSPGVGGAPRLLQSIVDHLNSRGHSVEALAFGAPVNNDCPAFDRQQSYPIYRIPATGQTKKAILLMGLRLLALACTRRYDLIFCGTAYPSVILARAASGLFPIPYLVYAHGEDASPIKNTRVKRFLLSHALRGASDLLVNSRFTRGEIADFGVEPSRIFVVPPGIDPAPYGRVAPAEVAALRRRLGLEGKRIILTVARLTERKGHDMIVRSLPAVRAAVPNAHYLIVGKGDTSALQALADVEGVAGGISIIPYIAEADLHALYHLCDVYAMVSRHDPVTLEVEGFGIVYLEAGACGKPCVAGSHGGSGDAVQDETTGFVVDPTDPEQIAHALITLLSDPALMARMGEAARLRVWKEFHRDRLLGKIEAHVVQAAGRSPAPPPPVDAVLIAAEPIIAEPQAA